MSGVDVVPAVIGINAVKWKTDGCFPTTVWKGSTRGLRLNNITQEKYNPGSLFNKMDLDELPGNNSSKTSGHLKELFLGRPKA